MAYIQYSRGTWISNQGIPTNPSLLDPGTRKNNRTEVYMETTEDPWQGPTHRPDLAILPRLAILSG